MGYRLAAVALSGILIGIAGCQPSEDETDPSLAELPQAPHPDPGRDQYPAEQGLAQAPQSDPVTTPSPQPRSRVAFAELDGNTDGRLDRHEASANPALAGRFAELDKDADGVLTQSEYSGVQSTP